MPWGEAAAVMRLRALGADLGEAARVCREWAASLTVGYVVSDRDRIERDRAAALLALAATFEQEERLTTGSIALITNEV